MENLKKELYCLVLLEKDGIPIDDLNSEYFNLVGTKINYDKSIYPNLESLIHSMSDCLTIKTYRGQKICFAITKKEVNILKNLIDGQKTKKPKNKSKFRSSNSSYSNKIYSRKSRYEEKENYRSSRYSENKLSNRFEEKSYSKRPKNSYDVNSKIENLTKSTTTKKNFKCLDNEKNKTIKSESKNNSSDKKINLKEHNKNKQELKSEILNDEVDSIDKPTKKTIVKVYSPSSNKIKSKNEIIENAQQELINKIIFVFEKLDDSYFLDHFVNKYNDTFKDPLPDDWLTQIESFNIFDIQMHEIGERVLKTIGLYTKCL